MFKHSLAVVILIFMFTTSVVRADQRQQQINQKNAEISSLETEWDRRAALPGADHNALSNEYGRKLKAVRDHYKKVDARLPVLNEINEGLDKKGLALESTGGSRKLEPKDIGADVDARIVEKSGAPASNARVQEGLDVVSGVAKDNNLGVNSDAARLDVEGEITTWKNSSPEGQAANAKNPDSNVTPGGLKATNNPSGITDELGEVLDVESKYETARGGGACDLKTMGKCVTKAANSRGNTRARVIEGADGKPTFDLQKGVDKNGNPTYSIPRDQKPGTNAGIVQQAQDLKDYKTSYEAGLQTPGAEPQVQQMELESKLNDFDSELANAKNNAAKSSKVRQAVRENIAESYAREREIGNIDASQRPELDTASGKVSLVDGETSVRGEIDKINTANALAEDQKIKPAKKVPTATESYSGGQLSTDEPSKPLFSDPELRSAVDGAGNNPSLDTSTSSTNSNNSGGVLNSAEVNAPSSNTLANSSPEVNGTTSKSRPQPLTEGKSSFASQTKREQLNNLPKNLDDAVEDIAESMSGTQLERGAPTDPDLLNRAGGAALQGIGVGMTAGSAYVAANNRTEANAATEKADKANEAFQSELENFNPDGSPLPKGSRNAALEQSDIEFANRTKADAKNEAALNAGMGAVGGGLDLLGNIPNAPAEALSGAGAVLGTAMDGFQAGNAIGKAEQARRSGNRATAEAARLRSLGLEQQAQRQDAIARRNAEIVLTEGEKAAGGVIKTGAGIAAAGGSAVAGVGLGAYALSRLGIENTDPGKALEKGKADLVARGLEWWNGAPEIDQESAARQQRLEQIRNGLSDGTYTIMPEIDKNDLDSIIDTANRTGDFTHLTAVLERPVSKKPQSEELPTVDFVNEEDIENEANDMFNSLDEQLGLSEAIYEPTQDFEEFWRDEKNTEENRVYDRGAMMAALGSSNSVDEAMESVNQGQNNVSARDATAFERRSAEEVDNQRTQAEIDRQEETTNSAIASAEEQHATAMNELNSDLRRRAEARDRVAGAVSHGVNQGVAAVGGALGTAAGDVIYEPNDCGCCCGDGMSGDEDHPHPPGGNTRSGGQSSGSNPPTSTDTSSLPAACVKSRELAQEVMRVAQLIQGGDKSQYPYYQQLAQQIEPTNLACTQALPPSMRPQAGSS